MSADGARRVGRGRDPVTRGPSIKFGILGTGRMATTMAATIQNYPGAEVIAVGSASTDRAGSFASRFGISRSYGELGDFLTDPVIDIVYVANSSRFHADACVAALNAGKNVLCEKPFALDGNQARQVADAAERSGCFFMEAVWTLILPAYERLISSISTESYGEPRYLHFEFGYPAHVENIGRLTAEEDGGVLFDRGCYGVALAIKLFGEVTDVFSEFRNATNVLQLRHENGVISHIAVSAEALLSNNVSVGCSQGCVGLGAPSIGAERFWSTSYSATPQNRQSESGIRNRLRKLPVLRRTYELLNTPHRHWLPYGADPYAPMLQHVIDRLAAAAQFSDRIPLSLSVATVDVLDRAKKSHGRSA